MSEQHLEETGEQLCWGPIVNAERMLADPEHMARFALEDLEAALARPAIGFEDREILKRCDGIINAGWERHLTEGQRRRLLEGRETLAARVKRMKKSNNEAAAMRIAEKLFLIAKRDKQARDDAQLQPDLPERMEAAKKIREVRDDLYGKFQALLDELSDEAFCRCVEAAWDNWVHGGPASFLQDVNVYHMAKMHRRLKAEAERQGIPQALLDQEKWAALMRKGYPGESHLSEGAMNKSYGFDIPLPFLPRHIAKYVTSRCRKRWYVPWMQWYLSYGATVDPKTQEWKMALEASYEPLVCKLVKKARRRISEEIPTSQRRELVERIEKQLRGELRQAIDDFDFFFKRTTHLGSKTFRLPLAPRPTTILSSNEIAFTAHVFSRLRRLLNSIVASDWQVIVKGCAQVAEIDGEPFASEHMASHLLQVSRQTLYNWRKSGKIAGYAWKVLSRSRKAIDLHDQKAPPSSWVFYSEKEISRLIAKRPQRGDLPVQPYPASQELYTDVDPEIAEVFDEFRGSQSESEGDDEQEATDYETDSQD